MTVERQVHLERTKPSAENGERPGEWQPVGALAADLIASLAVRSGVARNKHPSGA